MPKTAGVPNSPRRLPTDRYFLSDASQGQTEHILGKDLAPLVARNIVELLDFTTTNLSTNNTTFVQGFYDIGDGGGGLYYWKAAYSKTNHNGGTIIDPDHSVTPGSAGWWVHENTGSGCWLLSGADSEPLNVLTFGAKGNEALDGSGYDSWDAFDAAYRTAFWDHTNEALVASPWQRILLPMQSRGEDKGYYIGKQFNSITSNWPVASKGTGWTAAQAEPAKIEWHGEYLGGRFGRVIIAKKGDDYAFRLPIGQFHFEKLWIKGQGTNDPTTNTTESHPAILANRQCTGRDVLIERCGGPNYASREGPHISVFKGRVGYQIADGHNTPSSFALGLISDDSQYGAQGEGSNVNVLLWENLSLISIYGDGVFVSVSEGGASNANGSYFHVTDATNITGAIAACNGGWMNRFVIQHAISAETAFRTGCYGEVQCLDNVVDIVYSGDGLSRVFYLDDFKDDTNHFTAKGNIVYYQRRNVPTPFEIVSGARNKTLRENGVQLRSGGPTNDSGPEYTIGFGSGPHRGSAQDTFDGTAGDLSFSIVTDALGESDSTKFDRCTYEVYAKCNDGDGTLDASALFMVSFNNGSAEGGKLINSSGSNNRTISLDLSTPADPKVVFSSDSASNAAGILVRRNGTYFWGT